MRTTSIIGITTGAGTAEVTLVNEPPMAAILSGDLLIAGTSSSAPSTRKALTVVTTTPDADGEIQLTDVNKFNLNLGTGMKVADVLILKVMIVGEVMRP